MTRGCLSARKYIERIIKSKILNNDSISFCFTRAFFLREFLLKLYVTKLKTVIKLDYL